MSLRVVIADDERPARAFLAEILRGFADVELVGEAGSGMEVVALIERERPDLALLDLQMPEVDGLTAVGLVPDECRPQVAFVTAYDQYAVRAFELNAIDYLLKPVERERLARTIERARERSSGGEWRRQLAARLEVLVEEVGRARRGDYIERIPVRQREDIIILPVDSIASIVAEGEILTLMTDDSRRYYLTCPLRNLETRLDPARFLRLSRGILVRFEQIDRLSPMPGGTLLVTLHNRQELTASRSQARLLRERWLKI